MYKIEKNGEEIVNEEEVLVEIDFKKDLDSAIAELLMYAFATYLCMHRNNTLMTDAMGIFEVVYTAPEEGSENHSHLKTPRALYDLMTMWDVQDYVLQLSEVPQKRLDHFKRVAVEMDIEFSYVGALVMYWAKFCPELLKEDPVLVKLPKADLLYELGTKDTGAIEEVKVLESKDFSMKEIVKEINPELEDSMQEKCGEVLDGMLDEVVKKSSDG